jgi:hypothetical protein
MRARVGVASADARLRLASCAYSSGDVANLGPALFGGYACPASSLTYCDVEHKRMVR